MTDLPPRLGSYPGISQPGAAPATAPTPPIGGQGTYLGLLWNGAAWEPVQAPLALPAPAAGSITEAMLTEAVRLKLNPGEWKAPALGPKLQNVGGGFQEVGVRSEDGATMARLRGAVSVKVAEELKIEETVLTVPAGLRPPKAVALVTTQSGGVVVRLVLEASGALVINLGAPVKTGETVYLDGLTWNLT